MPNYSIPSVKVADGDDLKIFVNGTTTPTAIDTKLLKIGSLSYDFSDMTKKLQGSLSLSFSNDSNDFETNYTDLLAGTWIIQLDSTEYFRGLIDNNSFQFDRKNRTVSFNLFSGSLSEIGVDFSSLTTYTLTGVDYLSVSDWIDEIADSELGVTTSYDIQSRGNFGTIDYFFNKADATGGTDNFFLIEDQSVLVNRVSGILDLFGLKTAIWKGVLYVYEKDKYFSNTVTVTESDTQKFIEYLTYKVKDYSYNTCVQPYFYSDIDLYGKFSPSNFITVAIGTGRYEPNSTNWTSTATDSNTVTISSGLIVVKSFNGSARLNLSASDTQTAAAGEKINVAIKYQADLREWMTNAYVKIGDTTHVFMLEEQPTTGTDYNIIEFDLDINTTNSNIEIGFDSVEQENMIFGIDNISESSANIAEINLDSSEHGFVVGDLLRVDNTTNFDGNYEVTEFNVGGNQDVIRATKTITGSPSSETSGQVYKGINNPQFKIVAFYFNKVDKTSKLFTNGLDNANPSRLKRYDKNTSIVKSIEDDPNLRTYMEEVATIYDNRLGDDSIKKINLTIKQDNINPYSRVTIDSVNYLINKFQFNFLTKNKTIELVEE